MKWVMKETGYGRLPTICVDPRGVIWVAWVAWVSQGECIRVSRRMDNDQWSEPLTCTSCRSQVTALSMAPWKDGVLLAWIDGSHPENDGLKVKALAGNSSGREESFLIVPHRRGPSYAKIDTLSDRFALTWSVKCVGGRKVFGCFGNNPEAPLEPFEISAEQHGFNIRPSVTLLRDGACFVWESNSKGVFRILAQLINDSAGKHADSAGKPPIKICEDIVGICANPATCRSDTGVWIGWQSDRDPESGPGLVRWTEIAHLSRDGCVERPIAEMTGVMRDGKGEDQGFESPHLCTLEDGKLVLIGRGSQSVKFQILDSNGWSELTQIDEKGWKCRGRYFAGCPVEGGILVVGREPQGISTRFLTLQNSDTRQTFKMENLEVLPDPDSVVEQRQRHIIAGHPVLFGDLHQHTMASDGTGTAEEVICRARYRYRDDIVAVSDHESFVGKRTDPGEWAEISRINNEYYHPGTFVTLHAFEWTGKMHPGPGHKVVYLPPDGGPVLSREDMQTSTPRGLIAESRRIGAIVMPHHVGWTGANMDDHDPAVQTCWEIVSCHGAYERLGKEPIGTRGDDKDGQFVGDALDLGLRFGFVGGSDGHGLNWHHGVCRIKDSHRAGLTGVFSKEASREAVLGALKRRRCYATSGAKIGLYFEIDGRPMGEELVIGTPVPFRVVVGGTADIRQLALVTNLGTEILLEGSGREIDVSGTLPPPPDGGWCYYYVRVVQEDNEIAWSSPIWMDALHTA